ncbi:NAD(P)(+) transhydrogenase (Re/Si-specific) subunit beta [Phytohabitans sp. ZYX-F-186]|uniref:NAD(P) transhydrogenase subunit beta n=1 Tax=Phytohabitans maris TaxID=3071409 RepID=A0ABU0ZT25_9ACTN|nr:NAD(P)(+) transhydrogenase (Re/Si-specific) subunit beta [Phytohabitans sp. ZYX-F-186]MDQ7910183.1 NAD(P)(+) transhydrogenase (Re/Si-specific) subunit beta [Phytohabitans sp. ZYX-F-186]
MSTVETLVRLAYLAAATCFVLGLHQMNAPSTARRGNRLSIAGMLLAVAATLVLLVDSGGTTAAGWAVLSAGAVVGTVAGLWAARAVPMTAMPQLVSLFNAVGGGAAALVAIPELAPPADAASVRVPAALDIVIGAVTFAGSLVAAGKLQGLVPGRPVVFPGARVVGGGLALAAAVAAGVLIRGYGGGAAVAVLAAAALALGVALVLPIGGADMPVVISLLNAFTGTAVAMAGFVTDNSVLVVAGALVGASGAILTALMAAAMNRSLAAILVGGYGTGDGGGGPAGSAGAPVRAVTADDAAIQLAYARRVVVVPGYGLAAAQAQHALHELATVLASRGTEVTYAIHPVAGRMPGHMNVLLAEANVPYSQMQELDAANATLPLADVALVVGANDVTNPAARRPGNAISGMPILDVDRAAAVIVIKRSMGHGYAGIDNELYTDPKTGMLFADARAGLTALTAAVKTLVG